MSILALFQALNRAGRTIVMVTHDEHVARHARRILRLQDGALVGDEPVCGRVDAQAVLDARARRARGCLREGRRMMLLESFGIALRSLRANKMRSFLTMLGIIIGVASVITMVAVGAGAQTQVAEQIRSLGANVLMVMPGAARDGGVRQESGSRHTLTESDAAAIGSQLPQVQAAAPSIRAAAPDRARRQELEHHRQRHHRRLLRRPRLGRSPPGASSPAPRSRAPARSR